MTEKTGKKKKKKNHSENHEGKSKCKSSLFPQFKNNKIKNG